MRAYYVKGSLKQRRWMKKSKKARNDAFERGLEQFNRRAGGWIWVWDEEDRVSFAHHWLEHKPIIHKGRKP